ncbi:16796_t:CDS:1, partial [Acaulospora colombiana]
LLGRIESEPPNQCLEQEANQHETTDDDRKDLTGPPDLVDIMNVVPFEGEFSSEDEEWEGEGEPERGLVDVLEFVLAALCIGYPTFFDGDPSKHDAHPTTNDECEGNRDHGQDHEDLEERAKPVV